jgi:hypothetical protein
MQLKMRPTGLGSGAYKDNLDYSVLSGEWLIGRIYERNGFPDEVRFFWSRGVVLTRSPGTHTAGHAAALEEAKAQFQKSWTGDAQEQDRPCGRSANWLDKPPHRHFSAIRVRHEKSCAIRFFATKCRDPGWSGARDPMHASPKRLARTFAPHRAAGKRIPIPR